EFRGEKNFATLINNYAEGKPKQVPWAGPWWPYTQNGIAGGSAPAGKYDAARCNSPRSANWEVKHHGAGVKGVQGWWGHCNGWSVSAALYPEPDQTIEVNGISFEIQDIKGLLAEAAMNVH